MRKDSSNFSIFIIIVLFLIIFFIESPRDRITNLISCEGEFNKNERDMTTIVYNDGSAEFYTDYCVGKVLYEYYCVNNNEMRSKRFFCHGGCANGICFASEKEKLQILGLAGGGDTSGGDTGGGDTGGGSSGELGGGGTSFFRGSTGGKNIDIYKRIYGPSEIKEGLIDVRKTKDGKLTTIATNEIIEEKEELGEIFPSSQISIKLEKPQTMSKEELEGVKSIFVNEILSDKDSSDDILRIALGDYIISLVKTYPIKKISPENIEVYRIPNGDTYVEIGNLTLVISSLGDYNLLIAA